MEDAEEGGRRDEGAEPAITMLEPSQTAEWPSSNVGGRKRRAGVSKKRVVNEQQGIDEAKISETATKVRYLRNDRCPSRTLARTNGEPHLPADALHIRQQLMACAYATTLQNMPSKDVDGARYLLRLRPHSSDTYRLCNTDRAW